MIQQQSADSRQQTTKNRKQTEGNGQQTADGRRQKLCTFSFSSTSCVHDLTSPAAEDTGIPSTPSGGGNFF
jgi:hypothetical protein